MIYTIAKQTKSLISYSLQMAQVLHSRLKIMLDHNSAARWSAFQIRKIAKVLNWQAGRTKYDRIKQLTTDRADCEAFCFLPFGLLPGVYEISKRQNRNLLIQSHQT